MSYRDQFSAESILVIKKPPLAAPTIVLKTIPNGGTFLEDRFICFAYRYQYQNGEFSAVSQFSNPAFRAGPFQFTPTSFLNEGMVNSINAVDISFNTGGPLVTDIELLFKDMSDPTIKIIERFDKAVLGLGDNNTFLFNFENQKIFTVLPENEILRLYDNVPLKAQAQTLMGNRLVYGNYFEGYNLKDRFNNAVNFSYQTTLLSAEIEESELTDTIGTTSNYTFGSSVSIPNSTFALNLTGKTLKRGNQITWDLSFVHNSFYAAVGTAPTSATGVTTVSFSYELLRDYSTVYALTQDPDFISAIGTASNVQTVPNSCNGFTFTDAFNCEIPTNLSTFTKSASGVTTSPQGLTILSQPNSDDIVLQLLAMKWIDGANESYEYFSVTSISGSFISSNDNYSLHSNRGYEIGIIYMDDFNRSSTALVSPFNTVSTSCGDSGTANSITVNIPGGQAGGPSAQIAPYWATRYKFCIKPDKTTYETIFVSSFVRGDNSNGVYFLLEGENANKVEAGDRLIVKSDAAGVRRKCTTAVVLEKENMALGFIEFTNPLDPTGDKVKAPAGTYMKMIPNNFAVESGDNLDSFISYGNLSRTAGDRNHYPKLFYPVSVKNPGGTGTSQFIDYDIPAASQVRITIQGVRNGRKNCGADCERRTWRYDQTIIAKANYTNFKEFFDNEGLGTASTGLIQTNSTFICGDNDGDFNGIISYDSSLQSISTATPNNSDLPSQANAKFFFQFFKSDSGGSATGETFLGITGDRNCNGSRTTGIEVNIEVIRASINIVFETQPLDALPDVWYENDLSFPIDAFGQHTGSSQSQIVDFDNSGVVTAQDAIIDTGFSNCIAFGNGIESYKIRDSITGRPMNFGNRTTTTSSQIYKEAHRFSDLTYSGVFNDESNVNKLNEFNLGLLNFSPLEDSFGPIRKLYARRTDILTIQEDKISYVPVGKDLLTDATGGGALTSVPQVLGVQIARDEEYGISNNPESFAVWGFDKYFVDAKRGAVIRLRGGSGGAEELTVISERGMRGWFRDFFIDSLGTQKLGGYDPYMNEFVLAKNLQNTFDFVLCLACDVSENLVIEPGKRNIYCVDVGQAVGQVTVSYIIPNASDDDIITEVNTPAGGLEEMETEAGVSPIVTQDTNTGVGYTFNAYYNGVKYTSGLVFVSGSFTIPKNNIDESEVTIEASTSGLVSDSAEVTVSCPVENLITVYNIALTSNTDAGKTIHNEYRWTDNVFSSPTQTNLVQFETGSGTIISQYETLTGALGSNTVPDEGAIVSIISNKFPTDTYLFDQGSNKLRYLRSSTVYSNNVTDMNALVTASAEATPIINSGDTNYATFTMPTMTTADDNLYLIWDYRKITAATLCINTTAYNACCGCVPVLPTTPCGSAASYSGGNNYPDAQTYTLGSGTGTVSVEFLAEALPDRLIVEFDGAVVIDTRYMGIGVGSDWYKGPQGLLATLQGIDPDTGTYYVEPNNGAFTGQAYEPNGTAPLPRVSNGGYVTEINGVTTNNTWHTFTFQKTTATTTCTIKVYGPLPTTAWHIKIGCPT
tara:strand:+ start:1323 stop:5933 length:4611 start_codon:yes stop_codon:yes gene_type:complete